MEVKAGYKQTEAGVIPEDWEAKVFGDVITDCFSGATPRRNRPDYYKGNIRWITSGELNYNVITDTAEKLTREAIVRTNLAILPSGTFLMAITGLEAEKTRGSCGIVGAPATTNQSCMAVFPTNELLTQYLFHYYILRGKALALQYCQGTKQQSYTAKLVKRLPIVLPPNTDEQRIIAEVLSEVDTLIEFLEKLSAKKCDLKQAAMQQLLTGEKRLPGFCIEWEVKRLGDVCHITTGKKDVNEGNPDGQFPFFTCSRSHTFSDSYSFDTEAILIAGNGEVGNLHYFKGKFEAYQRTYILSGFSAHVSYLWHQLKAYLAGSLGLGKIGSSIPYIKKENLVDFEFNSPREIAEQIAIAEVLSDMDAEIKTLEQRLAKTRALKHGMMQELLTGRTRLI